MKLLTRNSRPLHKYLTSGLLLYCSEEITSRVAAVLDAKDLTGFERVYRQGQDLRAWMTSAFHCSLEEGSQFRLRSLFLLKHVMLTITFAFFAQTVEAEDPARMVAFIAAVGDYPGNSALYEAVSNGERIAAGLKESGFKVTTLFDFTRDEFVENYTAWCHSTVNCDLSVFYYCGHGGNYNANCYLVPVGADIDKPAALESQGIAFEELILKQMNHESHQKKRLNLVLIDGFQKNPFFLGVENTNIQGQNHSSFIKPNLLGEGTALVLPCTPGDLIRREDSRALAEAILSSLFQEGKTIDEGIKALQAAFKNETKKEATSYSELTKVQGSYIFSKDGPTIIPAGAPKSSEDPSDVATERYRLLRDSAIQSQVEGNISESLSLLLRIHDEVPEYREIAINRIRGVLASGDILRNPFKGREIIDSSEFDFMRLVNSESNTSEPGLGLPEARRLLWETERFFDKEKAVLWAAQDANSGNGNAMEALAKLFLHFHRDEEAFAMFTKASITVADPLESLLYLGRLYSIGLGCEKSFPNARKFLTQALREIDGKVTGLPLAAVQLGHLEVEEQYSKPPELRNFRSAVEFYRKAFSNHEYSGAANLGQLYVSGFPGVEVDEKEGFRILIEGADVGYNPRCMWVLASFYYQSALMTPFAKATIDAGRAQNYTTLAADLGYPEAIRYCDSKNLKFSGTGRKYFPSETAYQWKKLRETLSAATEKELSRSD